MRAFQSVLLLLAGIMAAVPAFASFGSGPGESPSPPATARVEPSAPEAPARQEAEKWYGDAYNDVARAREELAAGKPERAEKRFRKALERGLRAVELDSTYHEAWNLVGYSSRKVKDYDRALAAYGRCLAIRPDYAPAREYLGETYLELNRPDQAREQLAWLENGRTETERAALQAALDAWIAAHPQSNAAAAGSAVPAAADSASATTGQREKP